MRDGFGEQPRALVWTGRRRERRRPGQGPGGRRGDGAAAGPVPHEWQSAAQRGSRVVRVSLERPATAAVRRRLRSAAARGRCRRTPETIAQAEAPSPRPCGIRLSASRRSPGFLAPHRGPRPAWCGPPDAVRRGTCRALPRTVISRRRPRGRAPEPCRGASASPRRRTRDRGWRWWQAPDGDAGPPQSHRPQQVPRALPGVGSRSGDEEVRRHADEIVLHLGGHDVAAVGGAQGPLRVLEPVAGDGADDGRARRGPAPPACA